MAPPSSRLAQRLGRQLAKPALIVGCELAQVSEAPAQRDLRDAGVSIAAPTEVEAGALQANGPQVLHQDV